LLAVARIERLPN